MSHTLKREHGGQAEMSWIKPTCSCGWAGEPVHAWNDYQQANVKDQESEHCRNVQEAGND